MTTTSIKRKFVDIDDIDQEVGSSKRRRFEPNHDMKANCLQFIFLCFIRILDEWVGKQHLNNIHISNITTSAILSAFNALKQQASGTGSIDRKLTDKYLTIKLTTETFTITYTRIKEIITQTISDMEFSLPTSRNTTSDFVGTVLPILTYSYLNKLRKDELRVGHSKFDVRKSTNMTSTVESSSVGRDGALHILCEGITFAPERKTSMCQALGPLTMALELAKTQPGSRFATKWIDALSMAIAHVPFKSDIISLLRNGTVKACAPLIRALGKLLLITGERHTQRASIPTNIWVSLNFQGYIDAALQRGEEGRYKKVDFTEQDTSSLCKNIDFSGDGLWRTYEAASGKVWATLGNWDQRIIGQVTFHTIFGSFKENLALLAMVTSEKEWKTRKEIGSAFIKTGSSGEITLFKLPKPLFFSKMSSGNPTGIFSGKSEQICTSSPFAGHHVVNFGEKFFSYIKESSEDWKSSTMSLNAMIAELSRLTDELVKELNRDGGSQKRGNVPWYPISQLEVDREQRTGNQVMAPESVRMFLQD